MSAPRSVPVFRRLWPDPREVTAAELLDGLEPAARADRPYTLANFVVSLDGRVAVAGRSAPLSDEGDRAMFHELRERVDGVLAGTGTMDGESYGRLVRDPARRARRVARGLRADPLAALVTRSGRVPSGIPLFADPDSRVVILAGRRPEIGSTAAAVEVSLAEPGAFSLADALQRLRAEHDVRLLLCEGGPTLFSALLGEGLIDELFLTLSPHLAGGAEPTLTAGPGLDPPVGLGLVWTVEREGILFLRYRRPSRTGNDAA